MIGESDYTNVFSCGHIYDRDNFGLLDIRRQITVLCEARKRDWGSASWRKGGPIHPACTASA